MDRKLILFIVLMIISINVFSIEKKTHFITLDMQSVDGGKLGVNPGDTVNIVAGLRPYLRFTNFHGDSLNYIMIKNYEGQVIVDTETYICGIIINNSSYFRFSGTGSNDFKYGIKIVKTPQGANGLSIDGRSTDYEIDHIEASNTGFAGIMALTQPSCDGLSNRGEFIQRNTLIHDNYVHHTAGEGFYIGHSFYGGYTKLCGDSNLLLYPHEIHGLYVYNNIADSCGWDGIQVSCASKDCEIYGNTVSYYGMSNVDSQKNGILIGGGTTGRCYNNSIINGLGTGIMVFGIGENYIYNNVIVNSGYEKILNNESGSVYGIFCDDRNTIPNSSFYFINNTIISTNSDGIRFYSLESKKNKIINNVILNPGTYTKYTDLNQSYIYLRTGVDVESSNNYIGQHDIPSQYLESTEKIYNYCQTLALLNKGKDVQNYGINTDYYNTDRVKYLYTDIGAFEYDGITNFDSLPTLYNVYPNPNNGNFTVNNIFSCEIQKITIFDVNGLRIYETNQCCTNNENINLDYLPPGIYFMLIVIDGKRYSEKVVKY
jgi:hypothetical protein